MPTFFGRWIADRTVSALKLLFLNDEWLKARNATNSGDVNILKVNASNTVELGVVPTLPMGASITLPNHVASKSYVDTHTTGGAADKFTKYLDSTDISNQFVDLPHFIIMDTEILNAGGLMNSQGIDYLVSTISGYSRIEFLSPLSPTGSSPLSSGDIFDIAYKYN